ncbi:MAG: hypothetical protein M3Z85_01205 [Acidobacteriota bacterium]|nr:hypothetical protein [Acidobacteriota bacterium]
MKQRSLWASLASVASLAAALSCCLPLGTLLMAAGSSGASAFSERLRPYLLGFSVLMLALAFVQTYGGRKCRFRQRAFRTAVLWCAAALVGGMLLFPQFVAGLMTGHVAAATGSHLETFELARFERLLRAESQHPRVILLLSPT